MSTGLHANLDNVEIHKPFRQEFANATARTSDATVYTSADINKIAVQLDTDALYRLSSIGPTVWTLISPDTAGVNDHGGLTGLGDDDHTQYLTEARHDALPADNPHSVTKAQVGLSNVTDDSQLKRAGADFTSFAAKATPIAADTLLIEDSAAADAKKKVTIGSLPPKDGADHGNLTGLADDDHTQYLTEARHDALAADNPHSVTFTQGVAADAGTNITAAEAETLTDGSNADLLHAHAPIAGADHGGLAGLADDDHTQYLTEARHDALAADNPHSVTKGQVGLGNVTDDAQLKRSANDISTFTEKVTPVAADLLLIEDSAAAGVKKRVQVGNLPSGGGGGGTIQLSWKFSTTTTEADPGSTRIRYNNAVPASVTEIFFDDIALSGVDASAILNKLHVGDEIYIQQIDDATRFILCNVTAVVDNTGWFSIGVAIDDSGTLPANNADVGVIMFFDTTGIPGDQATVQARRTTDQAFTTAWVDVTFAATDVENQPTVVKHDDTNTDRLTLIEAGAYWISYKVDADVDHVLSAPFQAVVEARVRVNDGGVDMPGSLCGADALQDGSLLGDQTVSPVLTGGFPYIATANDFVSLQIQKTESDAGGVINAAANRTSLKATRLTGEVGPQGAVGGGGSTLRIGHTYGISGEIKVPAGQTDFLVPFFVSLVGGQTLKLVKARHRINTGTSVTCKLQKNDVDITGFTAISVTTTNTDTDPTDVTLADNDKIALVVTAVAGTPQNMSFTLFIEVTD